MHPERESDVVGAEVVPGVARVVALVGALHALYRQSVFGSHSHSVTGELMIN